MSVADLLRAGFLFLAFLGLAVFVVVEYWPRSRLGDWLHRRMSSRIKTLSELNSRAKLSLREFALIERDIPNIKSVVVVSKLIDEPKDNLEKAVIDNFKDGAIYKFFVSKDDNDDDVIQGYLDWFEKIFDVARGPVVRGTATSPMATRKFEDHFSIHRLPTGWEHVPYVFYTFGDERGEAVTIALKGLTPGVGISREYLRVSATEANAIVDLCSAASVTFDRAIEQPITEPTLPETRVRLVA